MVLLPLIFAVTAACAVSDPRAQAERLVKPPALGPVRAELAGQTTPTFAAIDALEWLERGPSATEDSCTLEPGNTKGIFTKQWWDVSCYWSTTRYYGFDGDFTARTQSLNDALITAGWPKANDLGMALDYYHEFHGRPEGTRKYDASFLPSVAYDGYLGNNRWTVRLSWGEAGQVPDEFERALPAVDYLHHEATEVDRVRVHREITSRHQYLLVVSVGTRYFTHSIE
ncbi:hypothetical protein [Lentzea sp. NPDC051838]|uniref:hypothetical protein n=1 Tax=Lentzea sp. NPDC051838 TaxID=3154849 RepID=UPI0034164A2C